MLQSYVRIWDKLTSGCGDCVPTVYSHHKFSLLMAIICTAIL